MAQSDASFVLPHIEVRVDADTINEENAGTNFKSDILRALADVCFQPSSCVSQMLTTERPFSTPSLHHNTGLGSMTQPWSA